MRKKTISYQVFLGACIVLGGVAGYIGSVGKSCAAEAPSTASSLTTPSMAPSPILPPVAIPSPMTSPGAAPMAQAAPPPTVAQQTADALVNRGAELFQQGRFDQALAFF